jgi:hypothetical protein
MRTLIFLSHAHEDKDLVGVIAEELRKTYGQDKVFYDSWSMKPGESLIGGMNKGLENCAYFFLFMSEISLKKPMVRLEWHNALLASLQDSSHFIPVRIDNISPPTILTTTLYLDMYNRGLPQTIEDMKLLIAGKGLYNPSNIKPFQNLQVIVETEKGKSLKISILAKKLMEPVNRFAFYTSDDKEIAAIGGMVLVRSGHINLNGLSQKVKILELSNPIITGNPQVYFINNPSNLFQLEIYHLPTSSRAQLIYSNQVNMCAL